MSFYRESRERKITFMVLERRLTEDRLIGRKEIMVGELVEDGNVVRLDDGGSVPSMLLSFAFSSSYLPCRTLLLSNLELHLLPKYSQSRLFLKFKLNQNTFKRT